MTTSHAQEAAKKRYGIDLQWEDLREFERLCRDNEAPLIRREHNEIRLVGFAGNILIAVYSRESGQIVTFLPPDGLESGARRKHRVDKGVFKTGRSAMNLRGRANRHSSAKLYSRKRAIAGIEEFEDT